MEAMPPEIACPLYCGPSVAAASVVSSVSVWARVQGDVSPRNYVGCV